ncbi:MAG: hypothetical protein ACKOPQ_08515 [Novosphingobium sp.]
MATLLADDVDRDTYGVLVGWKHAAINGKFDLQLQTKLAAGHLAKGEVETFHVVMTAQQATVLANYLLRVAEATPPPVRKSRLRRWFGG